MNIPNVSCWAMSVAAIALCSPSAQAAIPAAGGPTAINPQSAPGNPAANCQVQRAFVGEGGEASTRQLANAGIALMEPPQLLRFVEVPATCASRVVRVFTGGIVTDDGEFYELRPEGLIDIGKGQAKPSPTEAGGACPVLPEGVVAIKCLRFPAVKDRYAVLLQTGHGGRSIAVVQGAKVKPYLAISAANRVIDIAFLPAPDSAAGNIATFVRSFRGTGYMLILSPLSGLPLG